MVTATSVKLTCRFSIFSKLLIQSKRMSAPPESASDIRLVTTHSYTVPFQPFCLSWSSVFSQENRLAVSSCDKTIPNHIKIFRFVGPSVFNECEVQIPYPQTDLMFSPRGSQDNSDYLLSCSENVKLWQISPHGIALQAEIPVSEPSDPVTCVDWSSLDPNVALSGCVDATATAIDLSTSQIVARIIAHDHPIHDISFCGASPTFVTCSFDGSLRYFDLREPHSSYIYYQTAQPLLRLAVSPVDTNLVAVFSKGGESVTVIDTRKPGVPCHVCRGEGVVSCVEFSRVHRGLLFFSDVLGNLTACELTDGVLAGEVVARHTGDAPVEAFSIGNAVIAQSIGNKVEVVKQTSASQRNSSLPLSLLLQVNS